ncbi:hypothetical protein AgCh_015187 [Apium graveolens]
MRKDGIAKRTVISKYNNMMAALAGMTYNTIRRNMSTSGNLVVKLTIKIRDLCKEELKLLILSMAIISRIDRTRFSSITISALNHPKEKIVFTRELKVTPVDQTDGQEVAPRTRDKKWKLYRCSGKFYHSPLQSEDAVFTKRVTTP